MSISQSSATIAARADRPLLQRNRRVETYRELVRPIARHYARCSPESWDDLQQVGLLGLIRAAELYNHSRQTPFEAFARPHIRGAILHYLRDLSPTVRVPRRQVELRDRLVRLQRQGPSDASPSQLTHEWCGRLGLTAQQWGLMQQQQALARPLPLTQVHIDQLASPPCTPQPDWEGSERNLEQMLAVLEPRQRRVVHQVVLCGWSYRRLAAELEVSPMTVQRLLRRGLDRLRKHLDEAGDRRGEELNSGDPAGPAASAAPGCRSPR